MDQELIKTLKKFVDDPDWGKMEEYIIAAMGIDIDIQTIDTTKDSAVIVGEVMARQESAKKAKNLIANFNHIKTKERQTTQKKPLK